LKSDSKDFTKLNLQSTGNFSHTANCRQHQFIWQCH
jgi:hypothetical protein